MKKKRILLVDDEALVLKGLSLKIPWEAIGMELAGSAGNGREALEKVESSHIDIVITDILMPEIDGLELIERAMRRDCPPRFIVLSGHSEFELAQRAMSYGVRHYVVKPTRINDIIAALQETAAEIDRAAGNFYPEAADFPTAGKLEFRQDVPPGLQRAIDDLISEIRLGDSEKSERRLDGVVDAALLDAVDPTLLKERVASAFGKLDGDFGGSDAGGLGPRIAGIEAAQELERFRTLAMQVIAMLARRAAELSRTPRLRAVERTREIVRTRFHEKGLSLKRIASTDVFVNVDYLGRVFRAETGKGFTEYLLDIRMSEAAESLVTFPALTVREVAARVGFGTNSQYFCSTFRRRYGMTPSEYRRSRGARSDPER